MQNDTSRVRTPTPIHHHRARHTAEGNDTVTKRETSDSEAPLAEVTAARPSATSAESRATSAGSGADDCTIDRCVAVRW